MPQRNGQADTETTLNTLIYVEKQLILPIAAKLVGPSMSTNSTQNASGGFNWLLAVRLGYAAESGAETQIADLFPEDIYSFAYSEIERKHLSVRDFAASVSSHQVSPPDVVTIDGTLRFPETAPQTFNPFRPPTIDLPDRYSIYGFDCYTGVLEQDGFKMPVYFLADSADLVFYAQDKPVEIVGVVKWSPSYEVAGHAVNSILLAAALLLRR